jgi:hypothetical protein
MQTTVEAYEQRIRVIERRSTCFFLAGFLCLSLCGILVTTHSAVSQRTEQPTFRAPFRVTDAKGDVLFEVVDNAYGGKMILYARRNSPFLQASSGEMTTAIFLHQPGSGGITYLGANTRNGFLILESKKGKEVYHKP